MVQNVVNFVNHIDPRLRETAEAELRALESAPAEPLPLPVTVVLAGHRAAGKSRVLPEVARALGREAVDLDGCIEREAGGDLAMRTLVERAPGEFRRLERACFEQLPRGVVVALGGGFVAHHAESLRACVTALVPVTEATFRERLTADVSRPRLYPELSREDELTRVWAERELAHARVPMLSLAALAHRAAAGVRPVRIVTVRDGLAPDFGQRARDAGAEWLEVCTDSFSGDVAPLARVLPLLVAERGRPIPAAWRAHAHVIDVEAGEVDAPSRGWIRSFHAREPLTAGDGLAQWAAAPAQALWKHVEPLGSLRDAARLLELQRRLPPGSTVLATGALALPARARLGVKNALEYCALDAESASAKGQRLLADVVREHRAGPLRAEGRLGIVGHRLEHSRSPRIHRQPFDRIDVPAETDVAELVAALEGYRGLAVTSPFKRRIFPGAALNTLVRRGSVWEPANTDVAGARAALQKLGAREVLVLGQGGVADALREAAAQLMIPLRFARHDPSAGGRGWREALGEGALNGTGWLWTWPPHVSPPAGLDLHGARTGIICYGPAAQQLARRVRACGGVPIFLGSRWFIAQARAQRALWESP